MLKHGFNFIVRSKFVNENIFKSFSVKNEIKFTSKYSTQLNVYGIFQRNSNRPPFQNAYISYRKPAILLSGILSFLDFRQKQPEEPELIMQIKKGILFMQRGQFDKAEVQFHVALQLAQDENDGEGVTYIYDMLANLAFDTGNFVKAKPLFTEVLKNLLAKGVKQDSNEVIHISLKLAKIFQETKEIKLADQGFNFCINTLEKKFQEGDDDTNTLALWGMSMDWYGKFLLTTGNKNEAFECFKKAFDICVKINGVKHEQTVVLLNDLGTVSSLMGDNETAMSYFEQARDIGNSLPGMEDLPAIYVNLGRLYLLREMYKESKNACEEGLKKAKNMNDDVSSSEAQECLDNIEKALKLSKAVSA